jgi:hypothetical protein
MEGILDMKASSKADHDSHYNNVTMNEKETGGTLVMTVNATHCMQGNSGRETMTGAEHITIGTAQNS